MSVDLSIIIQEHNEGRAFVQKMISQAAILPIDKEVIYVTSMSYNDFNEKYGPFDIPVSLVANIKDRGTARTLGGQLASGDILLFMDSHVCYDSSNLARLLKTLKEHPDSIVSPGIQSIDFSSCKIEGTGIGYGVAMGFKTFPFEWLWLPAERMDKEFKVPLVCGCISLMKKDLFNVLNGVGGGLYWEEEKSMRLWRLGHPTFIEPRAVFGHYFKGSGGHKSADVETTGGYFEGQLSFMYVNIFNQALWDYIEKMLIKTHGNLYYKNLELAKNRYSWVRNLMRPLAGKIDETWFLRTK